MSYPKFACEPCCSEAGGKKQVKSVTWEIGICEVCGMRKPITDPKNFGEPKFKKTVYNVTSSSDSEAQTKVVNGKIFLSQGKAPRRK